MSHHTETVGRDAWGGPDSGGAPTVRAPQAEAAGGAVAARCAGASEGSGAAVRVGTAAGRLAAVVGLVLVPWGCGGESPAADDRAARTSPPAVAGDPGAPELEAEEALRIGGLEGEEPYLFSTLADVVRDGEGNYYVADEVAVEVRVFDPEGVYLQRFGRKGEGPGELARVDDLVLAGEGLAVVDRRRGGRVVVFSLDGQVREGWRTTGNDLVQLLPVAARDGTWLVERAPPRPNVPLGEGDTLQLHHSIHPLGESRDSVGRELARWVERVWYGSHSLLGPDRIEPLFRHPETVTAGPRGVLYRSAGVPYRVEVLDDSGGVVRAVGRRVPPVPVDERDYALFRDRLMELLDTTTEVPDVAKIVLGPVLKGELRRRWEVPRPDVRTVVGAVVPAADGSIWVERWDDLPPSETTTTGLMGREVDGPNRWDLFDPSGAFRGQVILPHRFRATHATGSTLTGILRDDYDLEYAVTYRVGAGAGG